jgi:hypothetical protein
MPWPPREADRSGTVAERSVDTCKVGLGVCNERDIIRRARVRPPQARFRVAPCFTVATENLQDFAEQKTRPDRLFRALVRQRGVHRDGLSGKCQRRVRKRRLQPSARLRQ